MRNRLRRIHEHNRAVAVRRFDHGFGRVHRAKRVRNVAERHQLGPRAEQFFVVGQNQIAVLVHGRDLEHAAAFLAEHLPRHDVRVVLHGRNDDLVAFLDEVPAVALRNEIDGLGRATDEDDFAGVSGADERADLLARGLVRGGGTLTHLIDAPVDVGALLDVARAQPIEDGERLLRGRGVVETSG